MRPMLLIAAALAISTPATACTAPQSQAPAAPAEVRIAVLADGVIEVDGSAVKVPALEARLDRAKTDGASVAYYREGGDADPSAPAEASMMTVLDAVMSRGLPIRLSSRPDFSDAVDENGQSQTRVSQ